MTLQAPHLDSDSRQLQQALWRWDNEGGAGPSAPSYPSDANAKDRFAVFQTFMSGSELSYQKPRQTSSMIDLDERR
jgi:hypothetical protein